MKRRKVLQSLAVSASAMMVLPSWANAWNKDIRVDSTVFSSKEKEMLGYIASTFIPEGKAKGAKGVGVEIFLDKLFSDCYEPTDQAKIKAAFSSYLFRPN